MMSMVKANNTNNVPIESILMRCSTLNNPANKPESIENNNKQAYICRRCWFFRLWLHSMSLVRFLLCSVAVVVVVVVVWSLSLNCCRISSRWNWFKLNFPNNLNVESFDSIVCTTRCTACRIPYKL